MHSNLKKHLIFSLTENKSTMLNIYHWIATNPLITFKSVLPVVVPLLFLPHLRLQKLQ